jgi:SET and MYND domain-containing protein
MATDKPADIIDAESAIEDDDDDDDDFTPSPRDALHTNADLCKANLKRIVSSVPLKIWSSAISTGSGLFAGAEVDKGHEIYHVYPTMAAIDAGNQSFCHNCLKNTHHTLGGEQKDELKTKACSACRVVRFCSKVRWQLMPRMKRMLTRPSNARRRPGVFSTRTSARSSRSRPP